MGANSAMNQSQFLAIITHNSLKAKEKSCIQGAIGFFASHWFKNWYKIFKPITKQSNIIENNNNYYYYYYCYYFQQSLPFARNAKVNLYLFSQINFVCNSCYLKQEDWAEILKRHEFIE